MRELTPDRTSRRRMAALLVAASFVIIAYWVAWFLHRSLVASDTSVAYTWFEDAFPLADGLLASALILGARALVVGRPSVVLWLLMGSGGGMFLCSMDVLYDAEHGVWGHGANGVIELVINIATLAVSVGMARWTWRRRTALLSGS